MTLHGDLEARLGEYTTVDLGDDNADFQVLSLKLRALIFDTIQNIEVVRALFEGSMRRKDEWL